MDTETFDKWQKQWDDALKAGIFKETPKNDNPYADDYFGVHRPPEKVTTIKDVDTDYWNKVYNMSNNQGEAPDILTEDAPSNDKELAPTTKFDGKKVSTIVDDMGKLANPVSASTRNQDANNRVTPNWAGGKDLIELHKMKEELHKLGDKLAADPSVQDKRTEGILYKIQDLLDKVDELSNEITPEFRTEYLS